MLLILVMVNLLVYIARVLMVGDGCGLLLQ